MFLRLVTLVVIGCVVYTEAFRKFKIDLDQLDATDNGFKSFKEKAGRVYKNATDEKRRKGFFNNNVKNLKEMSKRTENKRFKLGATKFIDWSDEEKKQILIPSYFVNDDDVKPFAKKSRQIRSPADWVILIPSYFVNDDDVKPFAKKSRQIRSPADWVALNSTKDWRLTSHLPPIRDQGQCGSCWAFAAIGAIETQWAALGNAKTNFSEQHLVDCETASFGCNGGYTSKALTFSGTSGNAPLGSYAYAGAQGACKTVGTVRAVNTTRRISDVATMEWFVNQGGPLVMQIYVPNVFFYYTGGIFTPNQAECSATNNVGGHAMSIVGYGSENGKAYWIVRNSWGSNWGEDGYVRIEKGINSCGIENWVYAPVCRGSKIA